MQVDLQADPGATLPEGAVIIQYEIPPLRAVYRAHVLGATCSITARNAFEKVKPRAKILKATVVKYSEP